MYFLNVTRIRRIKIKLSPLLYLTFLLLKASFVLTRVSLPFLSLSSPFLPSPFLFLSSFFPLPFLSLLPSFSHFVYVSPFSPPYSCCYLTSLPFFSLPSLFHLIQ